MRKKLKVIIPIIMAAIMLFVGGALFINTKADVNNGAITSSNNSSKGVNYTTMSPVGSSPARTKTTVGSEQPIIVNMPTTIPVPTVIRQPIETANVNKNIKELKIGDYIKYIPTKTSYSVSSSKTGDFSAQTFNPMETINWIVFNTDNGVEIINEGSVGSLTLKGATGYKNAVAVLNELSTRYINSNWAKAARSVGSTANSISQITSDLEYGNNDASYTDNNYENDVNKIKGNNLLDSNGSIWLASRNFEADENWDKYFVRSLMSVGEFDDSNLYSISQYGTEQETAYTRGVKVIVTLKDDIQIINGDGSKGNPYVLGSISIPIPTRPLPTVTPSVLPTATQPTPIITIPPTMPLPGPAIVWDTTGQLNKEIKVRLNTSTLMDWGDNTGLVNVEQASGIITLSHEYKNEGTYCVTIYDPSAITYLDCSNSKVSDLNTANFTALEYLICWTNKLNSLDLRKNTKLKYLHCAYNNIDTLDISNNTGLTYFCCMGNKLTDLDVSKNTNLTTFLCQNNQLKTLDVRENTKLNELYCSQETMKELIMDQNMTVVPQKHENTEIIYFATVTIPLYPDPSKITGPIYITYDANTTDEVQFMPENGEKPYGAATTIGMPIDPIREGYKFTGWNTAADGTGKAYKNDGIYTGNTSLALYAQWAPNSIEESDGQFGIVTDVRDLEDDEEEVDVCYIPVRILFADGTTSREYEFIYNKGKELVDKTTWEQDVNSLKNKLIVFKADSNKSIKCSDYEQVTTDTLANNESNFTNKEYLAVAVTAGNDIDEDRQRITADDTVRYIFTADSVIFNTGAGEKPSVSQKFDSLIKDEKIKVSGTIVYEQGSHIIKYLLINEKRESIADFDVLYAVVVRDDYKEKIGSTIKKFVDLIFVDEAEEQTYETADFNKNYVLDMENMVVECKLDDSKLADAALLIDAPAFKNLKDQNNITNEIKSGNETKLAVAFETGKYLKANFRVIDTQKLLLKYEDDENDVEIPLGEVEVAEDAVVYDARGGKLSKMTFDALRTEIENEELYVIPYTNKPADGGIVEANILFVVGPKSTMTMPTPTPTPTPSDKSVIEFTWDTTGQLEKSFTIEYDGAIDILWGDNFGEATMRQYPHFPTKVEKTHKYASEGKYTVKITGDKITYFNCASEKIISLDVSKAPALINLDCQDNLITELDISQNKKLGTLICTQETMKELIMDQNMTVVPEKHENTEIIYFATVTIPLYPDPSKITGPIYITYDANTTDEVQFMPENGEKPYGAAAILGIGIDPVREGYKFTGWNTAADGTGRAYKNDGIYTGNTSLTLYAQWMPNTTPVVSEETQYSVESYADVRPGDWYYNSEVVKFVTEKGYISGLSAKEFGPDLPMTRGQFISMLYNMAGKPEATATNSFKDVKSVHNVDAIVWGNKVGLMSGYPDGTFRPDASIDREQVVTVLKKYAEFIGINTNARAKLTTFNDYADVYDWAYDAVSWAIAKGIMKGDNYNRILPHKSATRAEVSAILKNFEAVK